jgi:DnaJ-class molecular chaperone
MPATITCPKCGGQGYDGIEEGSNPFDCYHCGTTGRIPVEQAINNMWESALIDARAEASEAERLSEKGIPF